MTGIETRVRVPEHESWISSAASVAEWSKPTDSSSVLLGGVGSNPTGCRSREIIKIQFYHFCQSTRVGRARAWSATTMRSCKSLAGRLAQMVARGTTNLEIAGSNPVGDIFRFQTKIEFYILLRSSQILMVTRICNHDEMLHIISKKKKASRST